MVEQIIKAGEQAKKKRKRQMRTMNSVSRRIGN